MYERTVKYQYFQVKSIQKINNKWSDKPEVFYLHDWESNGYTLTVICKILLVNGLPHKRRDDCPLKPVEKGGGFAPKSP